MQELCNLACYLRISRSALKIDRFEFFAIDIKIRHKSGSKTRYSRAIDRKAELLSNAHC